ncbi:O-antigen ligase family protein [Actinomycetospora sp. CA-101289]|uniref:O-antigen ligase family protein n=1 Tax=Actinomycetospora sp. CA-101289 TaxID=3239893 RepID=UPI003D96EC9F
MSDALLVVALFVVVLLAAPLVPLEPLIVVHMVGGSGRWAELPPNGLGIPLITGSAVVVHVFVRYCASPRGPRSTVRVVPRPEIALAVSGALFAGWVFASLFWSPSTEYGLEKAVRLAALDLVPAVVLYAAIVLGYADVRQVVLLLKWAATALSLGGVVSAFITGSTDENDRLSIGGTDPIRFGIFAGIGLLLWMYPMKESFPPWFLRWTMVILCAGALIGSDSKGPVIATAVALVVPVIRTWSTKNAARLAGVVLIAILAFLALPSSYTERFDPSIYSDPAQSESVALRQQYQTSAIEEFMTHPLAGGGAGSFNTIPQVAWGDELPVGSGVVRYPHLLPLEVAAELGVIGLALLSCLVYTTCRIVSRRAVPDAVLALLLISATETLFSGDISDHRVIWFSLALAAGSVHRASAAEHSRRVGDEDRDLGGDPRPERRGRHRALPPLDPVPEG